MFCNGTFTLRCSLTDWMLGSRESFLQLISGSGQLQCRSPAYGDQLYHTGDTLFQMTGKMSITADTEDNQLEIIVEDDGTYVKHFVGLSDNTTYVVEDLNLGDNAVSKYRYTLNFNPNMWIPVEADVVD
jgi:hypothetical protein